MKNYTLLNICLLAPFLISFRSQAQKSSFDSKRHSDTVISKSVLNAAVVNGQQTLNNQSPGNLKASISSFSATKNLRTDNSIKIITSKETGLPLFISTLSNGSNQRDGSSSDKKTACYEYLNILKPYLKITVPETNFNIENIENEIDGKSHIRLSQVFKGLKVYGSEAIVHLNPGGNGELFNGNYTLINQNMDVKPSVSKETAIEIAIKEISAKTLFKELSKEEKILLKYSAPVAHIVIYENKSQIKTTHLAYHISIYPNLLEHWEYFVDAKSGNVIHSYKNSCHVDGPKTATALDLSGTSRTVNTYQFGTNFYFIDATKSMYNPATSRMPDDPVGTIVTLDLQKTFGANTAFTHISGTTNIWNNPTAVSAHFNAGRAFDYYKNIHNRNSIDGKGGNIISLINAVENNGSPLDNAYWNGEAMFYGNGNTSYKPLAGSLDVAGHEMTHGVIQNTANLKYEGESGAINESMADIFGCMMDSSNWLLGEDIVLTSVFPSGALRSLSDPHNGGTNLNNNGYQPRHMSEKYKGLEDNQGVHINSGIPNYAFYKYAVALGKYKASKVFYRALTTYLTSSSQFIDLRIAVIQSAKDLYGTGSAAATQAGLAFDAVGLTDGTAGVYTTTLPVNPGTEYLLTYEANELSSNGLYRSSSTGTQIINLITRSVYNKPSVTDDGESCVVVGNDKKIYSFNLNPALPLNIALLQDEPIWSNVAVSRDGKRLAAITFDADTSIYVYDSVKDQWSRFRLYNPTFTEGVKSAGPVYADALEWSYDGESLVYDCFNRIKNKSGDNIEYWDINVIDVWSNTTNSFAAGEIFKLFNNLEEGESVGNPSFSKNSPNVIAFDYENEITNTYAVFGLDLEKNDLQVIAVNNTLGWPSYNKTDTKVAYTTFNSTLTETVSVNLNADKVSSNGIETPLVSSTKWPVYYSLGKRILPVGISENLIQQEVISVYPNPATDVINLIVPQKNIGQLLDIYNSLGVKIHSDIILERSSNINLNEMKSGIYTLSIKDEKGAKLRRFIKL